ncbi:Phosphatidylserine decarboxylase proenzyme [Giardia muris]|uniref:phosphatidylserine decarboxylase n=1 Tax=Giardia muris TaxID=5742 RepID=A0A4Z1SZX9_GIAMU|nr:Phosphatidylserine decarboxylase proenzyme [Giardia muris]|eukprot:TNJ27203.1 Phosphatidylserine decarboxylase proenzyme [Giardia muris]
MQASPPNGRRLQAGEFALWAFAFGASSLYLVGRCLLSLLAWTTGWNGINPSTIWMGAILLACMAHVYTHIDRQRIAFLPILVSILPRRYLSYLIGYLMRLPIPFAKLRRAIYRAWCWKYTVDIAEIIVDLDAYPSLEAFFIRPVNLALRPSFSSMGDGLNSFKYIGPRDCLIAPADSVLSALGNFSTACMSTVPCKGLSFSATDLLHGSTDESIDFRKGKTTVLHWAVFYLSPGDYHHFHAPCNFTVHECRHLGGDLWPVNDTFMQRVKGLLAANERVVLIGTHMVGGEELFFAYVAVGALNVGSIYIHKYSLETHKDMLSPTSESSLTRTESYSIGEEVGFFSLGSTVVLVYELPLSIQPNYIMNSQDKVHVGMPFVQVATT